MQKSNVLHGCLLSSLWSWTRRFVLQKSTFFKICWSYFFVASCYYKGKLYKSGQSTGPNPCGSCKCVDGNMRCIRAMRSTNMSSWSSTNHEKRRYVSSFLWRNFSVLLLKDCCPSCPSMSRAHFHPLSAVSVFLFWFVVKPQPQIFWFSMTENLEVVLLINIVLLLLIFRWWLWSSLLIYNCIHYVICWFRWIRFSHSWC